MTSKNKSIKGFALTELVIVMVIISLIIGMILFTTQVRMDASKLYLTKERMQLIQDAIDRYAEQYGHIPCPVDIDIARTDANYGVSIGNNSNPGNCTGAIAASDDTDIVMGGVPFKTLGLDPETAIDGWGIRLDYIMSEKYSYTVTYAAEGLNEGYVICNKTAETNCATGTNIVSSGDVAYILLSHGPNTYGGINDKTATQISTASGASADEIENSCDSGCNGDGDFDKYFVQTFSNDDNDDIMIFKQMRELPDYINTGF